jgi:hypothetical protein
LSLLSLPRAASRSRRLVVCGAAAALVLVPMTAQAETVAPTPAAETSAVAVDPAAATPTTEAPAASTEAPAPTTSDAPAATPTSEAPAALPSGAPASSDAPVVTPTETSATPTGTYAAGTSAVPTTEVPLDPSVAFPEIDPAVLGKLFVPVCDTGKLTGLTLQLDQLRTLLQQLKDGGFPVPDEAFAEIGTGTLDIPLDDEVLAEVATELNAASAQFAELGLADADLAAALEQLPAAIRADVEQLIGELQTGTVQAATLRSLLMELFPCPVAPPVAPPVVHEDVVYPGYAPTGGNGSTGGSPLALLGSGALLLAGGGLFAASASRARAARA